MSIVNSITKEFEKLKTELTELKDSIKKKNKTNNATLNDVYAKAETILKKDPKTWRKHGSEIVDFDTWLPVLYDKKTKKMYQFKIPQIVYDPDNVIGYINYIYSIYPNYKTKEKYKELEDAIDVEVESIKEEFQKSCGFIYMLEPEIQTTHYKQAKIKDIFKYYKRTVDNYNTVSVNISDKAIMVQLLDVQIFDRAYKNTVDRFKNDPKMLKLIDKIFLEIIKEIKDCMDYQIKELSKVDECFTKTCNKMEEIYKHIKE